MKRPYPNEPDVVRYTEEEIKEIIARGESRTDWERVENMRDEDIVIDEDAPEITEEMMANAEQRLSVVPRKSLRCVWILKC